jgi:hypothetical protein
MFETLHQFHCARLSRTLSLKNTHVQSCYANGLSLCLVCYEGTPTYGVYHVWTFYKITARSVHTPSLPGFFA